MRIASLVVIVTAFSPVMIVPAKAVPPTVTPSPGYEARLAEQRRAAQARPPAEISKPSRPHRPVVRKRTSK
ncbi:hypothetical protein RPMA_25605 [Tardiphaga alba]|uniref:Uncharacterized protein n=1 Tax=Tardiphaga alba TaxID=340268 RepID=A0ABX8AEY1_9BRAD|nr:hypothetical protein RPMA_25605 [Tardiphaga alba]